MSYGPKLCRQLLAATDGDLSQTTQFQFFVKLQAASKKMVADGEVSCNLFPEMNLSNISATGLEVEEIDECAELFMRAAVRLYNEAERQFGNKVALKVIQGMTLNL